MCFIIPVSYWEVMVLVGALVIGAPVCIAYFPQRWRSSSETIAGGGILIIITIILVVGLTLWANTLPQDYSFCVFLTKGEIAMPFVYVSGVPIESGTALLQQLRRRIVSVVSQRMGCRQEFVRPFFPLDHLDDPADANEGARTIHVTLRTVMFNAVSDEDPSLVTLKRELAECVWDAFNGEWEVELELVRCNPMLLIEAGST